MLHFDNYLALSHPQLQHFLNSKPHITALNRKNNLIVPADSKTRNFKTAKLFGISLKREVNPMGNNYIIEIYV